MADPHALIRDLELRVSAIEAELASSRTAAPADEADDVEVVWRDGAIRFLRRGVPHRADGPAVIWPDGRRAWWVDGVPIRVDGSPAGARPTPAPAAPAAPATKVLHVPPPPVPRTGLRPLVEALTGPRALAWIGGAVTLLGTVFLFVFAVSRGWIDEPMRVAIGTAVSLTLLGWSLRLHARDGRLDAVLAAAGAGIGGLYVSLLAATALYGLIDSSAALFLAAGVATLAVVVAVHVDGEPLAAFGLGTAMVAAAVVQGDVTRAGLAFTAVVFLAAVVLAAVAGWWRPAALGIVLTAPQALAALGPESVRPGPRGDGGAVALALVYAGLDVAAAFALRLRTSARETARVVALAAAALTTTVAITNCFAGELAGVEAEGLAFLAGAALWAAVAVAAHRLLPGRDRLADGATAVALAYLAAGCGEIFVGPERAVVWGAEAAALAAVAHRLRAQRYLLAAVAYLGLAVADAVGVHATPADLAADGLGTASTGALVALAAVTAAAAAVAAAIQARAGTIRVDLLGVDASGSPSGLRLERLAAAVPLALGTYLIGAWLGGQAVVVAWSALAIALAAVGAARRDGVALAGSAGVLAVAAIDTAVAHADPVLLLDGGGRRDGLVALGATTAAATALAAALRRSRELAVPAAMVAAGALAWLTAELVGGQPLAIAWAAEAAALAAVSRLRPGAVPLAAAGVPLALSAVNVLALQATPADLLRASASPADGLPSLLALCGATAAVAWAARGELRSVTTWAAGVLALEAVSLAILGVAEAGAGAGSVTSRFQGGHMAVSAVWAVTGLVLLHHAVRRGALHERVAAFALLGLALAKIFLYDLAFLSSFTRAGSFLAVGAALLLGSALVQRVAGERQGGVPG